ncbi:hypothetical protein C8R47DRAFT_1208547 [Mycena vitilis]|nr:hypothetical protein C8R47DRAFT_1208547 [Mycena vitilis]
MLSPKPKPEPDSGSEDEKKKTPIPAAPHENERKVADDVDSDSDDEIPDLMAVPDSDDDEAHATISASLANVTTVAGVTPRKPMGNFARTTYGPPDLQKGEVYAHMPYAFTVSPTAYAIYTYDIACQLGRRRADQVDDATRVARAPLGYPLPVFHNAAHTMTCTIQLAHLWGRRTQARAKL